MCRPHAEARDRLPEALIYHARHPAGGPGRVLPDIALAEAQDEPTVFAELGVDASVARNVALDFLHPVGRVVPLREALKAPIEVAAVPGIGETTGTLDWARRFASPRVRAPRNRAACIGKPPPRMIRSIRP